VPEPPTQAVRRRPTLTASAVATALAGGILVAIPPESVAAPPSSYGPKGIDTSRHNHGGGARPIDWRKVAAVNSFAFLKATQGTGYLDPWFGKDFKAASETSLLRAPYHFFDPRTTTDGAAQAETFIRTARAAGYTGTGPGELPPVLDVESVRRDGKEVCPAALRADQLGIFLARVASAFDSTPIVYTRASFVAQCMNGNGQVFRGYPLWLARYGSGAAEPQRVPGTGQSWTFWQYTESETVPGIPGRDDGDDGCADRNVYQGSLARLRAMANMDADPLPLPLPGIPWPAPASAASPSAVASKPQKRRPTGDRGTALHHARTRGLGGAHHPARPERRLTLDTLIRGRLGSAVRRR